MAWRGERLSKERWKWNSKSAERAVSCLCVGGTAVRKRLSEVDSFLLLFTPDAWLFSSLGELTRIEVLVDRSVLGAIVSEDSS